MAHERMFSSALAGRRDHMIFERIGALRLWSNSCSSRVALLTVSAALPGRASAGANQAAPDCQWPGIASAPTS
jgi:hypothetical protein